MTNFSAIFGKKVSKAREDLGMTMKRLGELVGLSEGTISRYERGLIKNIEVDKIPIFAKALNVDPVYLWGNNLLQARWKPSYSPHL